MRKAQRGVTFLGWLFLLLPLAVLVYAAIRLTPVYLNYMSVARSLEQAATENGREGNEQVNPVAIRVSVEKRFDIEGITHPTVKDLQVRRDGQRWVALMDYENVVPFVANVSLLVQFHKEVEL